MDNKMKGRRNAVDVITLNIVDFMPTKIKSDDNVVLKNETSVHIDDNFIGNVTKTIEFAKPRAGDDVGNIKVSVPFSLTQKEYNNFIALLKTMVEDPGCEHKDFNHPVTKLKYRESNFSSVSGSFNKLSGMSKIVNFDLTVPKDSKYFNALSKFYMPHCSRYMELGNLKMP